MKKVFLLLFCFTISTISFAQEKEAEYNNEFIEDTRGSLNDLKVYPNPTRNSLTVNLGELDGVLSFQINDAFGKSVYSRKLVSYDLQKDHFKLDMSPFQEGVYMFYIKTKTASKTIKVVKL